MRRLVNKYGIANVSISLICCLAFIGNCLFITKDSLLNISDNIAVAYLLNFLAGCEGVLGKWGCMSYSLAIEQLQLWRAVTNAYLHAGIFHMAFNISALLAVGKCVEKRIGTAVYLLAYHAITIIGAIIGCFIFTTSTSVGASVGIFGIIGIALVMCFKKQLKFKKSELVYLIIFVIASVMGLETVVFHILGLAFGVIFGLIVIRKNDAKSD